MTTLNYVGHVKIIRVDVDHDVIIKIAHVLDIRWGDNWVLDPDAVDCQDALRRGYSVYDEM